MSITLLGKLRLNVNEGGIMEEKAFEELTDENMVEFEKASNAIKDYITFLVITRKVCLSPDDLSKMLGEVIVNSILTWKDPAEGE